MKILITAATFNEIKPLITYLLKQEPAKQQHFSLKFYNLDIDIFITGIGLPATMFNLGKILYANKYDFAINAGICGSFQNFNILVGQTVCISTEIFGDLGINDNGQFKTLFETELLEANTPPFTFGMLINPNTFTHIDNFVDHSNVRSITVCTASGEIGQIYQRMDKFSAQVENMEGAAFFYYMLMLKIPFVEIRAVSNYIEPRDKEKWEIMQAINNLNQSLINIIMEIASNSFKF